MIKIISYIVWESFICYHFVVFTCSLGKFVDNLFVGLETTKFTEFCFYADIILYHIWLQEWETKNLSPTQVKKKNITIILKWIKPINIRHFIAQIISIILTFPINHLLIRISKLWWSPQSLLRHTITWPWY